ncbi:MAG: insulinase family protein [Planctomycetaceae bacterium]|nr:insulinase family protein [Planctomycetaceae bacterium]
MSRHHIPRAFLALCIVGWFAGLGRAEPAPPRKVATVEGITEYRLDNGLRVLLFPEPSRPKVTVNLTVFAGSRHEGYGETGMAHLLEHLLFKGTPTHPDIPKLFKERGAQFNGTTWVDRTNYFETLPASDENLELAIRLEADRLINSFVRREDLDTEMTVVRNEFEMGENSPENILEQRMTAVAYEWHNYGKSTIGNRSDIERVPIKNLQAFYRKHYRPDNALLVVAGRFDEAKALGFITRYFGALPKPGPGLEMPYTEEPAQDGERVVTLRRVGDVGVVGVLYHVPAGPHPEFAAVQVLNQILTAAPSGRLYKALVETKKAASVRGTANAWHDPGTLLILAEVPKGKSLDDVRDTALSVLEHIGKDGVSAEEVERARQQLLRERDLEASDPNRVAIRLSDWTAQGDWRLYFLDRDRIEEVTPEQVKEVAARYLKPSNRTVGLFIPTDKAERAPIPATPDLAGMVEGYKGREAGSSGESFDVAPARIEARVRRPEPLEGVKVALLPKKTRNASVNLVLKLWYGDAESLKRMVEAGEFLPRLMARGTKQLTRQQIQDTLDRNRARLNASGGRPSPLAPGGGPGQLTITIETRRPSLPAVLDVLRQILREPTLPESEFEILKAERLARLDEARTDPMRLAMNRLPRLLTRFPSDDVRYTPTIDEEFARVKETRLEQVKTLYGEYLGSAEGELAIVGDFEPSEVLPILARTLEAWKARQPYARVEWPFQPDVSPEHQTIATPDKANATYVAGLNLPIRDDHPDYPALLVGNSILGGPGLSSRLGDRLRQKGGLSYAAASIFMADDLDPTARLILYAIFNPANLTKVEAGATAELARLVRDGATTEEFERARTGYLEQQQVLRSNDAMLANLLAKYLHDGRTMKYLEDLEDHVRHLTAADVGQALRKHVDPQRLSSVSAGDLNASDSSRTK